MTSTAPGTRDVLTQAEAEARTARVRDCHYTLALDLRGGSPTYRGDVTITFEVDGQDDLFLDFRGKTIERLEANGREVPQQWTGYRLTVPGSALAAHTTLHVVYENEYDHGGDGFHQFVDPEDGEEYLYTNFEPYEAHRLFPCFDQPDIKATYALTVTAPANWKVVANAAEASAEPADDGRTKHVFAETKPLSTYLMALVAGPYESFHEQHGEIPLGLYCRKSLAPYLDTEELFTITRQGLDFYAQFFDWPYPFGKYDQLFVPEFNPGAMENAGAVTHNEFMVYRDPPTDNQRRRRAEVILHEMGHMWFGDLVTMRWWNDLWLNESFATYMAYLSMTSATRFVTGWQDFNASIKNWAYRQDQLVTTHPIAGQVRDTDETFLNFDGITYGKGASVLKQLVAAIGMDGFREGMRHYFRTHAYGNATLRQFLASLEAGSGRDLGEWSRLWLETASLNTIGAQWEVDGDRLSRLALVQTAPPDYPTLRPHQLEVGLLREEDGRVTVSAVPAHLSGGETEVREAVGRPRPSLVFPNYEDHAYAKVALDPESVSFAREKIEKIEDPFLRQLLWSSLWNMVRDQQLKSTEYLALVREKIGFESNTELVETILNGALTAVGRYVPDEWRLREAHELFERCWRGLRESPEGDAKIIWGRSLIAAGISPEDVGQLARLADGEVSVPGFTVDQQMRWDIAVKCVAHALPGAQERIAREAERDPSDRGQRAQRRAETSPPDATVKTRAWERFTGEGYGSLHLTAAAMGGFNWTHQRELLAPYVERFFEEVPGVFRTTDKEFYTDYFAALFPGYRVEEAILERSRALVAAEGEALPVLGRMLREANDELERAIRCRAYARGGQ